MPEGIFGAVVGPSGTVWVVEIFKAEESKLSLLSLAATTWPIALVAAGIEVISMCKPEMTRD
jgi:hypothetical protein